MKVFILSLIAIFFIASFVTEASAGAVCKSTGDPHYYTFNRHRDNLYGRKGDFLLAKDDKGEFIVQTRIGYSKRWRNKGINTAVAVKVGNNVVEHFGNFYKVNGQKNGKIDFKGKGSIRKHGNKWIVRSGNGERVVFHKENLRKKPGHYFNVYVRVPSRNKGKMTGLCGTYESRGKDKKLWKKPDAYRVKPDSTHNIFDIKYKGSEGSRKKHLNIKWPNKHMKKKAQKFCKRQQLTSDLYDDCVYDIKVSGKFELSKHYKDVRQDLKELKNESGCSRLAKKKKAYQKLVNKYKKLHRQHEKKADKHEKKLKGHHKKLKGHAKKRAQYLKQYKKYLNKSNQQKKKAKQYKKKANHHHGKYRYHLNKSQHYKNKKQQSEENKEKYKKQIRQHLKNAEHHQNKKQHYDKKYEDAKAKYNKFMHMVKFYKKGIKNAPKKFHKSYFTGRYNHFKRLAKRAQDKYEHHLGLKRKYQQLYVGEKKRASDDKKNMKDAAKNIKKYSQKASNHAKAASKYHAKYKHHLSTAKKFLKMSDKNEEKSDWRLKKADDQLEKIKLTRRTKTMLKRQHLITSKKAQEYEDRVDKYKEKADDAADKLKKCRQCIRRKENKIKQLRKQMSQLLKEYKQKKQQRREVQKSKERCGPRIGRMHVTVDNYIYWIKVNGKKIRLGKNKRRWNRSDVLRHKFKPGDKIQVYGGDSGGGYGLQAAITYYDNKGNKLKLYTDTHYWSCNGRKPLISNMEGSRHRIHPRISNKAHMIWAHQKQKKKSVCSVTLPKNPTYHKPKRKGEMKVTVDNYIHWIKVNGKKIKLGKYKRKWNRSDTLKPRMAPGDKIQVYGSDSGGGYGLQAKITYYDSNGKKYRVYTNTKQWKCDGKKPYISNMEGSRNRVKPNISKHAHMIWGHKKQKKKSVCSVTLPKHNKKKNYNVKCKRKNSKNTYNGRGNVIYLDRQNVQCGHRGLKQFRLRNHGNHRVDYQYTCCDMYRKDKLSSRRVKKHTRPDSDGRGNAVYLDRQKVWCGNDKVLSGFRLDRKGKRKIFYRYQCMKSRLPLKCHTRATRYNYDGRGNFVYLDRHNVKCRDDEFLNGFHLRRHHRGRHYRYVYKCCKPEKK